MATGSSTSTLTGEVNVSRADEATVEGHPHQAAESMEEVPPFDTDDV